MNINQIIETKRNGGTNSAAELAFISESAANETVSDELLTEWLRAAFENPLSPQETADLTLAMAASGERIDLTGLPKPWVDKHSTGGVGDKTTIVLLPLLAACGLTVVKMSGRGLGITGGTLDKLRSVPGFRMDLSPEEMKEQASRIGLAITGQTPRLAPADKKLYALRDVSGTVENIPLIVSSILSKKIAGGAETVILDVKCGSGSFMKTLPKAKALAQSLAETARLCDLNLHLSITDMNQPLGRAIGNALEIKEAIRVLKGEESGRFRELCIHFAGKTLEATKTGTTQDAIDALDDGSALTKAKQWFEAQGADLSVFENENWCTNNSITEIKHTGKPGWVTKINAKSIGEAVIKMGGGREKINDTIDPTVGLVLHVEVGDKITTGQTVMTVHGDSHLSNAHLVEVSQSPLTQLPIIIDT